MKRFLKIFFGIIIVINLLIVFSGKYYLYKAVWYNTVNIDDYKLFVNRTVEAGEPQPWKISEKYNKFKLPQYLTSRLEELSSVAFLVVHQDSLLFEKYWQGYSDSSLSNSFSMAKSYVSLLIGAAIKEGKINSLDQPVGDFLDDFKKGDKSKITIRHLLYMSGGLNWSESYWNPLVSTTEAYYGTDLRGQIRGLEVAEEPGKIWRYKSGDTQILSFVLKAATGKTLSAYAQEKLWRPMGCENDALWCLDKEGGDEKAYCCINSNVKDFARIGKLMLNYGNWEGKQLVDSAYVKECVTPNKLKWKTGKVNH